MAVAKVDCTCEVCGNTFEHRKKHPYWNREDVASYTAWAKENITLCPNCYSEAKKAEEARKIAEKAAKRKLPALVGSEKQIEWATKIRHEKLEEAKDYGYTVGKVRAMIAAGKEDLFLSTIEENKDKFPRRMHIALCVYMAIKEESAVWWIENR